jgi:hypothetical protein
MSTESETMEGGFSLLEENDVGGLIVFAGVDWKGMSSRAGHVTQQDSISLELQNNKKKLCQFEI